MRRTKYFQLTQLETRDTPVVGFTAAGAAAGGLPLVGVFRPDGSTLAQFSAFDNGFRGGVRAVPAELDGDPNTQEVVAGAGPGGGPAVAVFSVDVRTGTVTPRSAFYAFEPGFTGGVYLAAGNVAARSDGIDQIVIGAGEGGGPRVRTVDLNGVPVNTALGDFFAFEPSFRGGVRVAAGELDGNPTAGGDELAVTPGAGGGPRVRVLRSDGAVLADYFAFNTGFGGGVNLSVVNTGGSVGTLVPDAFALDRTQRNATLNTAAFAPFQQTGTAAGVNGLGTTAGANGLGSVPGIGGTTTGLAGGVNNIGGATTATGIGASAGVNGLGNTAGANGLGVTTGVNGISGTAINNLGVTAATQANGIGTNAVNNFGISGGTFSNGLTGANGFATSGLGNTGLGGTGFTNTGLTTGGFSTTGLNTAGLGTGFTTATGTTGNALSVPSAFAFGPFGDPGQVIATPAFVTVPFLSGVQFPIPV